MTEIERKALALLNEVARERGSTHDSELLDRGFVEGEALCRAIERHEAFRHEVSDAIVQFCGGPNYVPSEPLASFIIPKPDPLVEAIKACDLATLDGIEDAVAHDLRAAMNARGYEWTKIVEDK